MNATEGHVEAQTGRVRAEMQVDQAQALMRVLDSIRESDRARFRETMWLAALLVATVAGAAGLIIAVLR